MDCEKIYRTLVQIYAEQEGVEIETIREKESENK